MFLIIVGHYIYWGMKNLSSYGNYDITKLSGGGYLLYDGTFMDNILYRCKLFCDDYRILYL